MSDQATQREFFVRDHRAPGHFWADNEVIDVYGPQLGPHGIAVYMAMTRRADNSSGQLRLSNARIAEQIAMSKGGVFNALKLIVTLGLARILVPGSNKTPTVYVLADVKTLSVHPVTASVHPVTAAFIPRTRNKESNTSLNTKPPSVGSQSRHDGAPTENERGGTSKKCRRHPHSGNTECGGCYGCYEEKYSTDGLPVVGAPSHA